MAESEDTRALLDPDDVSHPPPSYDHSVNAPPGAPGATEHAARATARSLPLPTYTQSEKYEKEGVLEYDQQQQLLQQQQQQQRWLQDGREGEEEDENEEGEGEGGGGDGHTSRLTNPGTFCEFIIFFLVTAIFSVVGFIFAFCLAASVAGQSGAVAGLGIAFVSKPIIFELNPSYMTDFLKRNYCWYDEGSDTLEQCLSRGLFTVRLLMMVLGLIGLVLFFKGTSAYVQSRPSRSRRSTTV